MGGQRWVGVIHYRRPTTKRTPPASNTAKKTKTCNGGGDSLIVQCYPISIKRGLQTASTGSNRLMAADFAWPVGGPLHSDFGAVNHLPTTTKNHLSELITREWWCTAMRASLPSTINK
ncbi:hypothetical protein Ddc_08499 [Ditylenchus destructor]|nr:hypothetical protein Ddc_08499 [Ditylenchus destructor]